MVSSNIIKKINSFFPIDGDQIRILPFSRLHRDSDSYINWLRDYEVIKNLNIPKYWKKISKKEIDDYCQKIWTSNFDLFLALENIEDGSFIGTIKIGHINDLSKIADIGIMIGEKKMWGKGIATDAISILCYLLFYKVNFRKLTAGAMSINLSMIRVFEKIGFKYEGILKEHDLLINGKYCDHILLGCFKEDFLYKK